MTLRKLDDGDRRGSSDSLSGSFDLPDDGDDEIEKISTATQIRVRAKAIGDDLKNHFHGEYGQKDILELFLKVRNVRIRLKIVVFFFGWY